MRSISLLLIAFRLLSWRTFRRDWILYASLLMTCAVALSGYLSIEIATRSAIDRFQLLNTLTHLSADATIRPNAGYIRKAELQKLQILLDDLPVTILPIIERPALLETSPEQAIPINLVSSDLFILSNLANTAPPSIGEKPEATDKAFTSFAVLEQLNLNNGQKARIQINDTYITTTISSLKTGSEWPARTFLFDYPTAYSKLGLRDGFNRVELFLEKGHYQNDVLAQLPSRLMDMGENLRLEFPEETSKESTRLTQSFRYNLRLLTMIAFLAAIYLLMQVMDALVTRRQKEISILRSMGLSQRWLESLWIVESVIVGIVGSTLGCFLSVVFSKYAYTLISTTVDTLYISNGESIFSIQGSDIFYGYILGIIMCLLAGWKSARDAAATPPAQMMSHLGWSSVKRQVNYLPVIIVLATVGSLSLLIPPFKLSGGSFFPAGGILSALCLMVGGSIIAAIMVTMGSKLLKKLLRPSLFHYASSRLAAGSSRFRLATAGLFVATAMSGSVLVLVGSLDQVLQTWMKKRLQADVYIISPVSQGANLINAIKKASWESIALHPSVETIEPRQAFEIYIEGQPTVLNGYDLDFMLNEELLLWLKPPIKPNETAIPSAYISEGFAQRYAVDRGEILSIPTPVGSKKVFLRGIFSDYGNEKGSIAIDIDLTNQWFQTQAIVSMGLHLKDSYNPELVAKQWSSDFGELEIRQAAELYDLVTEIFEDTFAITDFIQAIALFIALSGLGLTLFSMIQDSKKEWRILNEIGLSRRQISKITAFEGLWISFMGGFAGTVFSIPIGWILIFHINKPSFGWSMPLHVPIQGLTYSFILISVTGLIVGWLVGRLSKQ